jgi:hypothetical protein
MGKLNLTNVHSPTSCVQRYKHSVARWRVLSVAEGSPPAASDSSTPAGPSA